MSENGLGISVVLFIGPAVNTFVALGIDFIFLCKSFVALDT